MIKALILSMLLHQLALSSCQLKSPKQDLELSFKDYLRQIPQIELPYRFACDTPFVWPNINYESDLIKKYNKTSAAILGKVFQSDLASGILYTYPADVSLPVIHVYDTLGEIITSIELYEDFNCWYENGCGRFIRGIITKDIFVKSYFTEIDCETEELVKSSLSIKKIELSGSVSLIKDNKFELNNSIDVYNLEVYLINEQLDDIKIVDQDCAILIYPSDKQIEEAKEEHGEDFAIIADDGSWYEYECNHLLDSAGIKVVHSNDSYLKLIGTTKSWTLDVKRKGLPLWNLIFFRRDKEPVFISMPGLSNKEIENYFGER